MNDKPMIFSGPMVRALLGGRKVQDRRVLKPQPIEFWRDRPRPERSGFTQEHWDRLYTGEFPDGSPCVQSFPYDVGDRLCVRETLHMGFDAGTPICQASYAADSASLDLTPDGALYWAQTRKRNVISPLRMPRWASRLTLVVTNVRVQRVQDISEADAVAEGARVADLCGGHDDGLCACEAIPARDLFQDLWNSIHGAGAWDRNDWVCALTFTVHHCNIDQLKTAKEAIT